MDTIEQLKRAISTLTEQEAKSLLLFKFIFADNGNEKELFEYIQSTKKSLISTMQTERPLSKAQNVHIVFGDSVAGSLKSAFRGTVYEHTEKIIVVPDILSVGPITNMYTVDGIESRCQWFQKHYRYDMQELTSYHGRMLKAVESIKAISSTHKIIIWTCDNAAEQTGLRTVMYLLKDKENKIYEINTFQVFHEQYIYQQIEEELFPRTSGELNGQQLLQMYEQFTLRPLTLARRQTLISEGQQLLLTDHLLRKWEHGELWSSNIEYYDDFIVQCAKRAHNEQGVHQFMKAARLIGEVIGHMQDYTGDEWIEYRLRVLIEKGIFEYEGELQAMRWYEVKLKELANQTVNCVG